jgi:hypothetical protein
MISTETVFDMLPSVVILYDKLDIDGYRKRLAEKNKGNMDAEKIGIDLFKYILKNSGKIKPEVFEIVATFEGKSVEEISSQSFMTTVNTLKDIFTDKETMDFFKQAMG